MALQIRPPDPGAFGRGRMMRSQLDRDALAQETQQREFDKQDALRALGPGLMSDDPEHQRASLAQLAQINPGAAQTFMKNQAAMGQAQKQAEYDAAAEDRAVAGEARELEEHRDKVGKAKFEKDVREAAATSARMTGMNAGDPNLPEEFRNLPSAEFVIAKRRLEAMAQAGQPKKAPTVQTFYDKNGLAYKAQYNQATNEWDQVGGTKAPSGMKFTVGQDGTVTFQSGGGVGGETTASTRAKIEKALVANKAGIARYRTIRENYDSRLQEIPTRITAKWAEWKDKAGGLLGTLNPEEKNLVKVMARHRQGTAANLNKYIKDTTGAQMSEKEVKRLQQEVPVAGTGIIDGDSPIVYLEKLNAADLKIRKAAARHRYYLEKGIFDKEKMAKLSPIDDLSIAIENKTGNKFIVIDGQGIAI